MNTKLIEYANLNDKEQYEYRLLYQLRYNRRNIIDEKYLKYCYDIPSKLKTDSSFISFVSDPFYPMVFYKNKSNSKKYFKYFKRTINHNIKLLIDFLIEYYDFNRIDFNYSLDSFYKIWDVIVNNLEITNKSELELQLESRLGYKNRYAMLKMIPQQELDNLDTPNCYVIYKKTNLGNSGELTYLWQSIMFYLSLYYIKCLQRKFKASRWKIDKTEGDLFFIYYLMPVVKLNFGNSDFYNRLTDLAIDAHIDEKGVKVAREFFEELLEKI